MLGQEFASRTDHGQVGQDADLSRLREALERYGQSRCRSSVVETIEALRKGERVEDLILRRSSGQILARAWMDYGGGAGDRTVGLCMLAVHDSANFRSCLKRFLQKAFPDGIGFYIVDMEKAMRDNFEQDSTASRCEL